MGPVPATPLSFLGEFPRIAAFLIEVRHVMDVRNEVVDMATVMADELGFEVVDVEYVPSRGQQVVRVYLDRPGGINLDDCARFSRRLGDLLEMNQTLTHAYTIEVSSPGIERRLRTEEHFRRYLGHRVRVELVDLVDGRRKGEGAIEGVESGEVTVTLEGDEHWTVPVDAIRQARLVVDPWEKSRAADRSNGAKRRRGKTKKLRHGG